MDIEVSAGCDEMADPGQRRACLRQVPRGAEHATELSDRVLQASTTVRRPSAKEQWLLQA